MLFTDPARHRSIASNIADNRHLYLPHLHSTPPLGGGHCRNIVMMFGVEKLEWFGYPSVKIFEDMFIRFDRIHERDGRTDTHKRTPHDG